MSQWRRRIFDNMWGNKKDLLKGWDRYNQQKQCMKRDVWVDKKDFL